MVDAFALVVPAEDESLTTIRDYYEHYLDRMRTHVDATTIDELRDYEAARERLEDEGTFMIYERFARSVAEHAEPSVPDVYSTHANDRDVVDDRYVLAKLARALERARRNLAAAGELSEYDERDIDAYLALVDYAIANGYGISYP